MTSAMYFTLRKELRRYRIAGAFQQLAHGRYGDARCHNYNSSPDNRSINAGKREVWSGKEIFWMGFVIACPVPSGTSTQESAITGEYLGQCPWLVVIAVQVRCLASRRES